MIGSDNYLSISPEAVGEFTHRMLAYAKHLQANGITDGPADEAERDGLPIKVVNGIAIIPIMGPLIRRAGPIARFFGISGTDSIRIAIRAALADEDIEKILLHIDSPGGSVPGLDQLGDTIHAAEKPVIAQVDGMAASAAYYIASQADQIIACRSDLIGSIGTRMLMYDWSEAFKEAGIKPVVIDTGEHKSAGAAGTEITESQQAHFQHIVDFYFEDFISAIMRGRSMSREDVLKVADGRMFTPQESMQHRLIDGVATLEETLNSIRTAERSGRSTQAARRRLQL